LTFEVDRFVIFPVLPKTELERKDKKRIVVRMGKTILDFREF